MDDAKKDPLLKPRQVAQELGVATRTLRDWRTKRRHELPFIELSGREVRYRRSALERFLEAHTVAA